MANNSSNDSSIPLEDLSQSFSYYSLFTLVFFHLPLFTVNILLLVAIITEKTMPVTVRLVLANIVASSEVVIIGLFGLLFYDLIIPPLSPLFFICRLIFFTISSGAAARLLYMATYAVTVYVLARYAGTNLRVIKLRFWPALLAVLLIWILAIVPNMVLLSPVFFEITLTSYFVCTSHTMGATSIAYTFGFIIVYGVGCFILSIIFPILTMGYIKKNTMSNDKQTLKSMIKFSVFLLLGNSLNIVGTSFPLLLGAFTSVGEDYEILVILEVILLILSLLTTPFILLIFFKTVRKRVKMITCFICLNVKVALKQTQTPRQDVR